MPAEKANKQFKDDQTEKRIHEHLSNENDHISDEDIRNVKTNVTGDERIDLIHQPKEEKLPGNDKDETPEKNKTDDLRDPGIETPWNILK